MRDGRPARLHVSRKQLVAVVTFRSSLTLCAPAVTSSSTTVKLKRTSETIHLSTPTPTPTPTAYHTLSSSEPVIPPLDSSDFISPRHVSPSSRSYRPETSAVTRHSCPPTNHLSLLCGRTLPLLTGAHKTVLGGRPIKAIRADKTLRVR